MNKYQAVNSLNSYQKARWIALMECITIIDEVAEKKQIPVDQIQYNHPAMMHYVDEVSDHIQKMID